MSIQSGVIKEKYRETLYRQGMQLAPLELPNWGEIVDRTLDFIEKEPLLRDASIELESIPEPEDGSFRHLSLMIKVTDLEYQQLRALDEKLWVKIEGLDPHHQVAVYLDPH